MDQKEQPHDKTSICHGISEQVQVLVLWCFRSKLAGQYPVIHISKPLEYIPIFCPIQQIKSIPSGEISLFAVNCLERVRFSITLLAHDDQTTAYHLLHTLPEQTVGCSQ